MEFSLYQEKILLFFFFFFNVYASFIHQSQNNRVQPLHWGAEAYAGLCAIAGGWLRAGCVVLQSELGSWYPLQGTRGLLWDSQ